MKLRECLENHWVDLVDDSKDRLEFSVKLFEEFLTAEKLKLKSLTQYDICKFVAALRQRKGLKDEGGDTYYSNKTIRNHLFNCKAVCRLADVPDQIWNRAIKRCPTSKYPDKRSVGRLQGKEIKAFIDGLPKTRSGYLLAAFLGLTYGGTLRRGDTLKLKLGDIRIIDGALVCYLKKTKNKRNYKRVIAPFFVRFVMKAVSIRQLEGATDEDHLLTSRLGSVYHRDSIYRKVAYWSLKTIGKKISTHWGRYSGTTRLLELGKTYREVQEVTGHESVEMIERYDQREFSIAENPAKDLNYFS